MLELKVSTELSRRIGFFCFVGQDTLFQVSEGLHPMYVGAISWNLYRSSLSNWIVLCDPGCLVQGKDQLVASRQVRPRSIKRQPREPPKYDLFAELLTSIANDHKLKVRSDVSVLHVGPSPFQLTRVWGCGCVQVCGGFFLGGGGGQGWHLRGL
jgi:hypothetical protein